MQQTSKYQFNLVEMDDVFSTKPLNENTEKTEAALQALESGKADLAETGQYLSSLAGQINALASGKTDAADTAALSQRVAVLEARRAVLGSYQGDKTDGRVIHLGFTPATVLLFYYISSNGSTRINLLINGQPQMKADGVTVAMAIVDDGFYLTIGSWNALNCNYFYLALA